MVGLITTYVPLVLGVLLGLVAGYRGGWLETVVMRAVDVVVAFPFIVLVIAVIAIVGPGCSASTSASRSSAGRSTRGSRGQRCSC